MIPEKETFTKLFDRNREIRENIVAEQSARPSRVESGDLFYLKMPIPVPVTWCAVFTHSKDDELWYCVPGDSFSIVANTDVTLPSTSVRTELHFRCHCGLWVHADDIDLSNRVAQLNQSETNAIREKVSNFAMNPIGMASDDLSHDPDYVEWIQELRYSIDALTHSLHDEPTHFVRVIGPDASIEVYSESLSLAADDATDTGVGDESLGLLETRQVFDSSQGRLLVNLYEDGLLAEWHPNASEATTPKLELDSVALKWFLQGDYFCTQVIPWDGSAITLQVDSELISVTKPQG